MPRPCSICQSNQRVAIDQALIEATPFRTISRRFGVSRDAVRRHRLHIRQAVERRAEVSDEITAGAVLQQFRALTERATSILNSAERRSNLPVALKAIGELRLLLTSAAELCGTATPEQREIVGATFRLYDPPEREQQNVERRLEVVGR